MRERMVKGAAVLIASALLVGAEGAVPVEAASQAVIAAEQEPSAPMEIRIQGTCLYTEADRLFTMINQKRAAAGVEPLQMDEELLSCAMTRSAELQVIYSDQRPNGFSFDSISPNVKAEMRLMGVGSAGDCLDVWMESAGYQRRLLDEEMKSIGIGCFSQGKVRCWVLLFGTEEARKAGERKDQKLTVNMRTAADNCAFYMGSTSLELKSGKSKTLKVMMKNPGYSEGSAAVDPSLFVWKTSDKSVATVDRKGKVTAKKGGTAVITATSRYDDKQEISCEIRVGGKVSVIRPESRNIRLAVGKKYRTAPVVLPESASNKRLSFVSSDPETVSVDTKGTLLAKKEGKATITCRATDGSGKKASFTVTVKNYASSVRLSGAVRDMIAGKSVQLTARAFPVNALSTKVIFRSSDEKVASVTEDGLLKALRPGKATITAKAVFGAGAERQFTVTVHPGTAVLSAMSSEGELKLFWKRVVGADRYTVYCSKSLKGGYKKLYEGSENSFTTEELEAGEIYYLKMRCGSEVDGAYVYGYFCAPAIVMINEK